MFQLHPNILFILEQVGHLPRGYVFPECKQTSMLPEVRSQVKQTKKPNKTYSVTCNDNDNCIRIV